MASTISELIRSITIGAQNIPDRSLARDILREADAQIWECVPDDAKIPELDTSPADEA